MHSTIQNRRHTRLAPRLREIQARWSSEERRHRAEHGRRRLRELLSLLRAPAAEPEIWAVGAPGTGDVPRLVG